MKRRLPASYYNFISISGTVIAAVAFFMFVFLYVVASLTGIQHAYEGIVIFMIIPAFLVLGLLLIPLGMSLTAKRMRAAEARPAGRRVIDLNNPANRRALIIFSAGTLIFLFLSALGSYEAYNFTDSVLFCGTLCHKVMKPEYTTYKVSPHARVACVDCHVGPGASWYVKSKLSGLYQVYATLADVYPRPIPAPVRNLRPARETCERCHWPQKVYGKQERIEIHYLPDEANTRWTIEMLLNTGAGNQALGFATGIHWHIREDVRIEYVPADEQRQQIARVIMTDVQSGMRTVFDAPAGKGGGPAPGKYPARVMDCIDCHNRPSHIYKDPLKFINEGMVQGLIDPGLPFIKKAAAEACLKTYASTADALKGLSEAVRGFYTGKYAALVKGRPERVEKAASAVVEAYLKNIFPDMKALWSAYPDNIGHLGSPGCFRCHDGQHASAEGRVIGNSCDLCHAIQGQGTPETMAYGNAGASLLFKHPVDIGDAWKGTACSDCHSSPSLDF